MKVHTSHTLYMPDDFTPDEMHRRNTLGVSVIYGGLLVCKVCGNAERGLKTSCLYNQQARRWERLDAKEEWEEMMAKSKELYDGSK